MDLATFTTMYVPIINVVISAIGLGTIVIAIYQFRKTTQWNRLQSQFNFIDTADGAELQASLYKTLEAVHAYSFPEHCRPISQEAVAALCCDREAVHAVNTFLNHLQNQCTAFHYGIVDRHAFLSVHAGRVCWWYTVLAPYVHARRSSYRNAHIWEELETTAVKYMQMERFKTYREAPAGEPGNSQTATTSKPT